jgi:REG-2-like HAD superfamily hydrolase
VDSVTGKSGEVGLNRAQTERNALPLNPELITFDCAQTLIEVDWKVGEFAVTCATYCGLELPPQAADLYLGLYQERHKEYLQLNLTRDRERCDAFWDRITKDWLSQLNQDADEWFPRIKAASKKLGFSEGSIVFNVYEDVLPCLALLRKSGLKTAIISNWDYSLHPILEVMKLREHFDLVIASLEEGFEKPDPRIFTLALERLGVKAQNAIHIGDDPIDDLQGARNVGMGALLLDRKLGDAHSLPYISSLLELPGVLGWST